MVVTGAVFKDIADAIREKDGSTETMKISQMAERIRNIPQGGGGERLVNADHDVIFFGCDGAVLYAYDREEFLEINELPPPPEYVGLVAQCWNMTLEELQNQLDNCAGAEVGALYTTEDNASWIVLNVPEQYTTLGFRFNASKEITINFGDGTDWVILSSSTTDTYYHTFPHGGRYTVKVRANEENSWSFVYDQTEAYAGFVRNSDASNDPLNKTFKAFVERVHLAYGARFNSAAYLYNLCIFTTSQDVVWSDVGLSFRGDYYLKCVTIPSTYTHTMNTYAFQNTFCLRFVSLVQIQTLIQGICSITAV